jgi:hypothetical protein
MRSLQLSVYRDNIAARHLYEACGWRPLPGVLNENDEMRYFRILDLNQKV